jgi:hypothetical protein
MTTLLNLLDKGQNVTRVGIATTIAILGVCSGGVANTVYELEKDSTIADAIGDGPLTECTGGVCRTSRRRQLAVKVAAGTAGVAGAVTATPSAQGPLITLSGTPYDNLTPAVKVTKGGAQGVGQFAVATDGYNYASVLDIPAPTAATVVGTGDITAISPISTLNGQTLILNIDGAGNQTVTFASVTVIGDVATQVQAVITTRGTASIVAGRYLQVVSATTGTASTILLGNGTANTNLGFANAQSTTGAAATYLIPKTGIAVTFPAGTYVAGVVYTFPLTAPRFDVTAMNTALDALRNSNVDFDGIQIFIAQDMVDAAELLNFATALDVKMTSYQSGSPRKFKAAAIGAPLGGTGASNIATNDTAVKNALASFTSQWVDIVHGDCYRPGTSLAGTFRRSGLWSLAAREAAYRLSSDPGNGEQPALEETSLVSPPDSTGAVVLARDENTATVKMRPQRFTVLKTKNNAAYFDRGVTRAAANSKFRHMGVRNMALLAAREVQAILDVYENADRDLNPDGTLREPDAAAIDTAATKRLEIQLIEGSHASAVVVKAKREEIVGLTDNLTIDWQVQHRGQFVTVTGNLGIVSQLTLS